MFHRKIMGFSETGRPVPERAGDTPESCFQVEQIIILPDAKYRKFRESGFLIRQAFLSDFNEKMWFDSETRCFHCVLVKGETGRDGILAESEGYQYARYAAFVPDCSRLRTQDVPVCVKRTEKQKNIARNESAR